MNLTSEHLDWLKWISDPETQNFILLNADRETSELAFELADFAQEKRSFILNQISGRQKAKKKIPEFASVENIIYPPKKSIEQSSSSITALYKSSLFHGKTFLDLTGGFGVDSYHFSKNFESVEVVEKSDILFDLLKYNFSILMVENCTFHCNDAVSFITKYDKKVDLIYIDPSRRSGDKRLLDIREYDPNILELSKLLKEKAVNVLIKLSPVSDLRQIIKLIPNIVALTVVSVKNECREILLHISGETHFSHDVLTIDLTPNLKREYKFNLNGENDIQLEHCDPKKYLYLPMTAVIKAGAFKSISRDFNVDKLAGNTHIYTSSSLLKDFPGKSFECIKTTTFNKKELRKNVDDKAFTIQCRNFPLKTEQVAQKLGISDYGELHLLAYRNRFDKLQISIAREITV